MQLSKVANITLALSLVLLQCSIPANAALSPADVANSIYKRDFLAPGTSVNVRIDKDQVFVSTYRHASSDEKDCKIDAILIARAAMDLAPNEISRVTSYFFGKDLSNYQEVAVTAGDIKAFASGQSDNDQLLSSLTVKSVATQSASDKVARQLENSFIVRASDYRIAKVSDAISVTTPLDPWVSDEDSKLEALRIAINTMQIDPTAQQIRVNFVDPASSADTREVTFKTGTLSETWKAIQNSLGSVTISKVPVTIDIQGMKTFAGPQQAERDALLAQLKDMDKKGIGVTPFVKVFIAIEQAVKRQSSAKTVADMVTRLKSSVDDQLKAYNAAKEAKVKAVKPAAAPVVTAPVTQAGPKSSRWVTGNAPVIEGEVLADPDALLARYEVSMAAGFKKVDDNPKFVLLLDQIASILHKNNRAAEAAKFQQRAIDIRSRPRK